MCSEGDISKSLHSWQSYLRGGQTGQHWPVGVMGVAPSEQVG